MKDQTPNNTKSNGNFRRLHYDYVRTRNSNRYAFSLVGWVDQRETQQLCFQTVVLRDAVNSRIVRQ